MSKLAVQIILYRTPREQSISSDKFYIPTIGDSLLDSPTWLLATVLPTAFHRGYLTVGWYTDSMQLSVYFATRSMTVGFNRQFESFSVSQ